MMKTKRLYAKEPCESFVAEKRVTINMIRVEISTVNMTGFFTIILGFSLTKDCFKLSIT